MKGIGAIVWGFVPYNSGCVLDNEKSAWETRRKGSVMAKGNNAQGKDKKKAKAAPKKDAKAAKKTGAAKKG